MLFCLKLLGAPKSKIFFKFYIFSQPYWSNWHRTLYWLYITVKSYIYVHIYVLSNIWYSTFLIIYFREKREGTWRWGVEAGNLQADSLLSVESNKGLVPWPRRWPELKPRTRYLINWVTRHPYNTVLLTMVTMLCIMSPCLINLITRSLYLLTTFTHFTPLPSSFDNHQSVLFLLSLGFLDSTYKWDYMVFVSHFM